MNTEGGGTIINTNRDSWSLIKCKVLLWSMFLIGLVLSLGTAAVYFRTPPQEITIIDANLTRFELASSPVASLFYNLTFTMSIHNSDWNGDAYFKNMEVDCYYNDNQFESVELGDFKIKNGKTRLFNMSRSGNSGMNLESSGFDTLGVGGSNEMRFIHMEIWLQGKRLLISDDVTNYSPDLSYQCKLRLPLITAQSSTTQHKFNAVSCLDNSS